MRLGIAHHYGWAVAVTASEDHEVIDRRRIDLIEPGLPSAPVHHVGGPHEMHKPVEPVDDGTLGTLVTQVRASVLKVGAASLEDLEGSLPGPITSISLRDWPDDFPTDIATLRRVPYESRADSVMYCQVLADIAEGRGWQVHRYDARGVEARAAAVLGARAGDVLNGPRERLGPPWTRDHRTALAATIPASPAPRG